jgi:hypothetical protein
MKHPIAQQHPPMGAPMKPKGAKNAMPESMSTPPKMSGKPAGKSKLFRDGKY